MTYQLDELDRQLIALLMEDASRTNVAMARLLGVSDGTVRNRIQNLLQLEIMQLVAIIDPWKVGHRIQIFSGLEVDLDRAHEVAQQLAEFDEVTYVSYTTGEFDILMVAALRNQEELFNFLTNKIGRIEGIRRIRTNQVLKAVKRTFRYDRILRTEEDSRAKNDANSRARNSVKP
jgi:Lrp/AsnC family transcriptional regulator, regulator for asnA, asnC and gidA